MIHFRLLFENLDKANQKLVFNKIVLYMPNFLHFEDETIYYQFDLEAEVQKIM